MKKSEIKIGEHYAIRHHTDSIARLSVVRVDSESIYGGWNCTKLTTGRTIRVKSPAKFRYQVVRNPVGDSPKWVTADKAKQLTKGG